MTKCSIFTLKLFRKETLINSVKKDDSDLKKPIFMKIVLREGSYKFQAKIEFSAQSMKNYIALVTRNIYYICTI